MTHFDNKERDLQDLDQLFLFSEDNDESPETTTTSCFKHGSGHSQSPPIDIPGNDQRQGFVPIANVDENIFTDLRRRVFRLEEQVLAMKTRMQTDLNKRQSYTRTIGKANLNTRVLSHSNPF
jgi:hypothetical protein